MSRIAFPFTVTGPVVPVAAPSNEIEPPAPPFVPPFAVSVALPGVELPVNCKLPPPEPVEMPPLIVKFPLPAVEWSEKLVVPPGKAIGEP